MKRIIFLLLVLVIPISYFIFQESNSTITETLTQPKKSNTQKETEQKDSLFANLNENKDEKEILFNKLVLYMRTNSYEKIYDFLAPSLKELFPKESYLSGLKQQIEEQGDTLDVEIIQKPTEVSFEDSEFRFADSVIKITRENKTAEYLTRFVYENGQWWLFASDEIE